MICNVHRAMVEKVSHALAVFLSADNSWPTRLPENWNTIRTIFGLLMLCQPTRKLETSLPIFDVTSRRFLSADNINKVLHQSELAIYVFFIARTALKSENKTFISAHEL